jgi:hypothetical protein
MHRLLSGMINNNHPFLLTYSYGQQADCAVVIRLEKI